MILSIILGVLDILGGILLIAGGFASYESSGFILTVGGVFVTKGLLLFLYKRFGGKPQYDIMAIVDIIAGMLMVSMFYNIYSSIFVIIAAILILKGAIGSGRNLVGA